MEAQNTQFPPLVWRVYNYSRGRSGPVITGSTMIRGKVDLCTAMLGKAPNRFEGGRILANWLEKNFNKLPNDAMEELHKVDMQGKYNEDWAEKHNEHIQDWDCRMKSITSRESFFSADMTIADDYLT
ncbi:hypothetical protein J1N35_000718 [Gossypium stocksii]|uniref:Uncharacterized protein n=1 Tax=Gossypium stocksii TaxID=47602 RepID=A0A9D3WHR2_9ROSI|nr:hypothetical protein J1N35_000718 [Gossypium stocksii]